MGSIVPEVLVACYIVFATLYESLDLTTIDRVIWVFHSKLLGCFVEFHFC